MQTRSGVPKITVLMAVYNGEQYLREAIESILGQTLTDFEFLIVNDGSTDSSPDIVRSYKDSRICLIDNRQNLGLSASLNRGLKRANGSYIARQDADDISEPERLAWQVAYLEAHSDVALLGTWYKKIDAEGNIIGNRRLPCSSIDIRWALLFFCPFVHSAVMFRKTEVLEHIGFYNEALQYSMDYDLWNRIAHHLSIANLNSYLVRLRSNPGSMTATYGDRALEGQRLRIDTVAQLLDWDEADRTGNGLRFKQMYALLFAGHLDCDLQTINDIVEEIVRLQLIFCQHHQIDPKECLAHSSRVRAQLSRRLVRIAQRYNSQGDPTTARQLLVTARKVHPPIVTRLDYLRLSVGPLLPSPLVTIIRLARNNVWVQRLQRSVSRRL